MGEREPEPVSGKVSWPIGDGWSATAEFFGETVSEIRISRLVVEPTNYEENEADVPAEGITAQLLRQVRISDAFDRLSRGQGSIDPWSQATSGAKERARQQRIQADARSLLAEREPATGRKPRNREQALHRLSSIVASMSNGQTRQQAGRKLRLSETGVRELLSWGRQQGLLIKPTPGYRGAPVFTPEGQAALKKLGE